jgi:hypothetical protein
MEAVTAIITIKGAGAEIFSEFCYREPVIQPARHPEPDTFRYFWTYDSCGYGTLRSEPLVSKAEQDRRDHPTETCVDFEAVAAPHSEHPGFKVEIRGRKRFRENNDHPRPLAWASFEPGFSEIRAIELVLREVIDHRKDVLSGAARRLE